MPQGRPSEPGLGLVLRMAACDREGMSSCYVQSLLPDPGTGQDWETEAVTATYTCKFTLVCMHVHLSTFHAY